MLDFTPVREREMNIQELADQQGLTVDDLRRLTHEMIDHQLALIADCTDADVVFVPQDPDADDPYAADPDDADLAWTLGHVVVHVTASSEETAFLAAELARGVEWHGRSRSEIPWESVTTIQQCRERLEESRRMRLATLDVWPDKPYLDNTHQFREGAPKINAIGYFIFGLAHDDGHLAQIADIVQQAKSARASA